MNDLKAVIFDWAGTMIDFGSIAPMGAFVEAFSKFDIPITIADARAPMGLPKRDHIAAILEMPHIAEIWRVKTGTAPDETLIDHIYDVFVPLNESVVVEYCDLVPGAKDTIAFLKARNIKIGSTTGYTRSIMARVLPLAKEQGYEPENLVCADDLSEGRPGPLMMYRCFTDLAVYPPQAVMKVDDTVPGIAEGVAAGCITVGVALSGNIAGLTFAELENLTNAEREILRTKASGILKEAGADHIIDSVADLPLLIEHLFS